MSKPSKSRRRKSSSRATTTPSDIPRGESLVSLWLRSIALTLPLTLFLALTVATCLVPSETPPVAGLEIPLVMAWVLLLVTWAVAGLVRRDLTIRIDAATVIIVLFFVWLCLSSAWNLSDSRPRATLNATFRWLSFGIAFFLARQLLIGAATTRTTAALLIALATGISALGVYQYAVAIPALQAEYHADPQQAMFDAGVMAAVDSPVGEQFRNRVESSEPLGTFALTNSLAGFLAPWLIVAIGLFATEAVRLRQYWNAATAGRNARLVLLTALALAVGLIGFCLLLTKSRSAWAATAGGCLLLALGALWLGYRAYWKFMLGGLAAAILLLLAAIGVGALDIEVASEAAKSLSFRLQFWQATAGMIADHVWFGVGVGNFQEQYAAYKLPAASEMIADPHNFLLEVAATSGTPAALLFIAAVLAVLWQARPLAADEDRTVKPAANQRAESNDSSQTVLSDDRSSPMLPAACGFVSLLLAALLAFPLNLLMSGSSQLYSAAMLIAMPVAALVLVATTPWQLTGRLPRSLLGVALVALLVNLLAAGGIGFASVSIMFWIIAAMLLTQGDARRNAWQFRLGRGSSLAVVTCSLLMLALLYLLAYRPVLQSRLPLQTGEMLVQQGRYAAALPLLEEACQADALADEPYRLRAIAHQRLWLQSGSAEQFRQFESLAQAALARNPHSHNLQADMAQRYLEAYRATEDQNHLVRAIDHQQAANGLYPNRSLGHAQLAWLHWLAEQKAAARAAAQRALELDRLNPHDEQALKRQKVFDVPGNLPAESSAESVVNRIIAETE